MNFEGLVNAAADIVGLPPGDGVGVLKRLAVFIVYAGVLFWFAAYWPFGTGWIGGYLWGCLTVYGTMRRKK